MTTNNEIKNKLKALKGESTGKLLVDFFKIYRDQFKGWSMDDQSLPYRIADIMERMENGYLFEIKQAENVRQIDIEEAIQLQKENKY